MLNRIIISGQYTEGRELDSSAMAFLHGLMDTLLYNTSKKINDYFKSHNTLLVMLEEMLP